MQRPPLIKISFYIQDINLLTEHVASETEQQSFRNKRSITKVINPLAHLTGVIGLGADCRDTHATEILVRILLAENRERRTKHSDVRDRFFGRSSAES